MPPLKDRLLATESAQKGVDLSVPFATRMYNLIAGRSEFTNPNAGGKMSQKPAEAPAPANPPPMHTDEEKKTILGVLFGEVSNRPVDKQLLEAKTILNTARNRAKVNGTSIYDEMTKPHQYQAYKGSEYNRYLQGRITVADQRKIDAITKTYLDLQGGKLEDNISGYQFYVHLPDGSIRATKDFEGVPTAKKSTGKKVANR